MDYMFYNCSHLNYLDISNFSNSSSFVNAFKLLPSNGTIKLNKDITNKIEALIPKNWIVN
jgi:hypothetical protein